MKTVDKILPMCLNKVMRKSLTTYSIGSLLLVVFFSVQGISHSGTENELVKARMASMKNIAANMKSLSKASKGRVSFDLNEIKDRLAAIESSAAETPHLFEINATDPTSEAASEIWENFQDFTDKAFSMESTAKRLIGSVASAEDLAEAVKDLGGTCKSCHSKYRN